MQRPSSTRAGAFVFAAPNLVREIPNKKATGEGGFLRLGACRSRHNAREAGNAAKTDWQCQGERRAWLWAFWPAVELGGSVTSPGGDRCSSGAMVVASPHHRA
jgi:hypothetical protein